MASCYLCESAEGVIEHRGKKVCVKCFNFPLDIAFSLKADLEGIEEECKEAKKGEEEKKLEKADSPPTTKSKGGKG